MSIGLMRVSQRNLGSIGVLACLIVLLMLAPFLLNSYWLFVVGFSIIMAITGIGYNLVLGYNGLLSLGHGAFFGIGAYSVALLMRYVNIHSWEVLLLSAIAFSVLFAVAVGFLCLRHIKIYFVLITLAFNQVVFALTYKLYWLTRGSDGLPVPAPSIFGVALNVSRTEFISYYFYYYILGLFILLTVIMWVITNSPFGKTIKAIKDNATRVEFLGLPVWKYRLVAFVISSVYAGIGGALFAVYNGFITPDFTSFLFSGEIVFFTLLGGIGVFYGPIIGAFIYSVIKIFIVTITIYWQLFLGAALMAVVLAFRGGVGGILQKVAKRFQKSVH
jgi:branched-chain amino acid transport system permease protein